MQNKTFRLFVSSTFDDFKAERNVLQRDVFPLLRKLCAGHGAKFQAIDLRWGVSEEAAYDQQTIPICLEELRRCLAATPRPNFIALLGDRYGWRPLPAQIPLSEFMQIIDRLAANEQIRLKDWYVEDRNAVDPVVCLKPRYGIFQGRDVWCGIEADLRFLLSSAGRHAGLPAESLERFEQSATEQEIKATYAALSGHAFAYFRTIDGLPSDASSSRFRDICSDGAVDTDAKNRLKDLKEWVKKRIPRTHRRPFTARWEGSGVSDSHLTAFGNRVYDDLSDAILKELRFISQTDELDREIAEHRAFGDERAIDFTGRDDVIAATMNALSSSDQHAFVLRGPSGCGKSAVMGHLAGVIRRQKPSVLVVQRHIGATPASSEPRALLDGMCREIGLATGDTNPVPNEFRALAREFSERLVRAAEAGPLVLLVDALDQLADTDGGRNLSWFPTVLPPAVHLVATTCPGPCAAALEVRLPEHCIFDVEPMAAVDGRTLLDRWLHNAGRTLQPLQREAVLDGFARCGLPLYLRLAYEQARHLHEWDPPPPLGHDVASVVNGLLDRLGSPSNHGRLLVSRALGLLGAARNGLTEDELLDVLAQDDEYRSHFLSTAHHDIPAADGDVFRLPVVVWSRLHYDLAPYLGLRHSDGGDTISFFHAAFARVVGEKYLSGVEGFARHSQLAAWFAQQPLYAGQDRARSINLRKIFELPWQQAFAGDTDGLADTLCDLAFVEAKCAAGQCFDLVRDCDRAVAAGCTESVSQIRCAISDALVAISARPQAALESVINRLRWLEGLDSSWSGKIDAASADLDRRGPWVSACAALPGARSESFAGKVPFGRPSPVQAISPNCRAVAVALGGGEVEIRDLEVGGLMGVRSVKYDIINAVAINDTLRLAWQDDDGTIRCEQSSAGMTGRHGERVIAWFGEREILAVRADGALVAWDSDRDYVTIIASNLPFPLIALQSGQAAGRVLFVAGDRSSLIGLASSDGGGWSTRILPWGGAPVLDARMDDDGHVLVASRDRVLRVVDAADGGLLAELACERLPDVVIRGLPLRCTWGRGPWRGWAFVATHDGNVAGWDWKKGTIVSGPDYCSRVAQKRPLLFESLAPDGRLLLTTAECGTLFSPEGGGVCSTAHIAEVSSICFTSRGNVVSASRLDRTLKWSTPDGLDVLDRKVVQDPTVVASLKRDDDVVVGTFHGTVGPTRLNHSVDTHEVFQAFAEPVAALFDEGDGAVVAVARSGKVLRINLDRDVVDVVRHGNPFHELLRVLSAGRSGLLWDVHWEASSGESVVCLVHSDGSADEVFRVRKRISDASVTPDGKILCLMGTSVVLLRASGRKWVDVFHRDKWVQSGAFACGGSLLVVAPGESSGIEVWQVSDGMPTVAAVDLGQDVTRIVASGSRVIVGCQSGDLVSLRLRGT